MPGGPWLSQQVTEGHWGCSCGAGGSRLWKGALQLLGGAPGGQDELEGARPEAVAVVQAEHDQPLEDSGVIHLPRLHHSTKPQFMLMALSQGDKVNHTE